MTSWLTENSVVDTGIIQEVFVTQLLHTLGVSDYMKKAQCNKLQPPFNTTNNNRWNVNSKLTNITFTKSKMWIYIFVVKYTLSHTVKLSLSPGVTIGLKPSRLDLHVIISHLTNTVYSGHRNVCLLTLLILTPRCTHSSHSPGLFHDLVNHIPAISLLSLNIIMMFKETEPHRWCNG